VHPAIVDFRDVPSGLLDTIDFEPRDAPTHRLRILDDDEGGAAGLEDPCRSAAGLSHERLASSRCAVNELLLWRPASGREALRL